MQCVTVGSEDDDDKDDDDEDEDDDDEEEVGEEDAFNTSSLRNESPVSVYIPFDLMADSAISLLSIFFANVSERKQSGPLMQM